MPIKHGKYRWLELLAERIIDEMWPLILVAVVIAGAWMILS